MDYLLACEMGKSINKVSLVRKILINQSINILGGQ